MEYQEACSCLLKHYNLKYEPTDSAKINKYGEYLPVKYYLALLVINKMFNPNTVISSEIWDNLEDMFDDMTEHAKNNGRAIVNFDLTKFSCFGWHCTNTKKTWIISTNNFKDQLIKGKFDKYINDLMKADFSSNEEFRKFSFEGFSEDIFIRNLFTRKINNFIK